MVTGLTLNFYGKVKFAFWAFIWVEFMDLIENFSAKINKCSQISEHKNILVISLVFSAHISFYTLCKFCRDFHLRLLIHALLQQSGASMLSEKSSVIVLPPILLVFPSDITLSRKKCKRE